jgi:hypothetical protein
MAMRRLAKHSRGHPVRHARIAHSPRCGCTALDLSQLKGGIDDGRE